MRSHLIAIALAAGCAGEIGPNVDGLPGELPTGEAAQTLLIRASLDLEGRRPDPDAVAAVAGSRDRLAAELEKLMDGRRFGLRVRDWFAVAYRTRFDDFDVMVSEESTLALEWGEAPLKFYEEAALGDLPLTDVVTADYTFAGPEIAAFEPIEGYDSSEGGWQRVRYSDGRPAAGVLATTALWGRYVSNESNVNRGRANAVSRILLCDDFLRRPVDFPRDIDLSDTDGIENAIRENQGCQACHAALDPLAAYFAPFNYEPGAEGVESLRFGVGAADYGGSPDVAPAYFGHPGDDIGDLGRQIAADPRFARCAVRRVYEGLMGRPITEADANALNVHEQVFVDAGMRLRPLVRSIVRDPVYAGAEAGVEGTRRSGMVRKIMSPEVLELAILDVTNYRATFEGEFSVMRGDNYGLHVLGGGLDARAGDHLPQYPNATRVMVQRWLAEAAAAAAIDAAATVVELFGESADLDADFDAAAARRMLERVLGIAADADLADARALFTRLREAGSDPRQAWQGVLTAFLRVPEFVTY